MSKIKFIIGVFLISILLISGCSEIQPEEEEEEEVINTEETTESTKVTLASGEWAPYVSENLKYEGVVSRIVKEAFKLKNIEVEYIYLPWQRSIEGAKNGKWHGTLPWLKNEERLDDFYFSDPIARENVLFFHKKDLDFDWESVSDLEGYSIGGTTGYFYGEDFEKAEEEGKITIERVTEDSQNLEKLAADRIDIIICEINVGYDLIETLFSEEEAKEFTHHPKSISANPLYLLLSKHMPENKWLIELFNSGLKELEEQDKIEQYWEESRKGEYKNK